MPIKQLDNRIRNLPRLGKIKLGKKETKNGVEYPQAVDYFICPPVIHEIYGEKPKKLEILLPSEELDLTFPHWYKLYGRQRGLICKGDGESAQWRQEDGTYVDRECPCPLYEEGKCKMIGTLNLILPKIEGIGVYQIVTSSYFSITNILNYLDMMQSTIGKISFIPLALEVRMEEFNPTVKGKQMRTVNPIMHLVLEESFETLAQKAKAGVLDKTIRLGLPGTVELEKADSDDELPEELYPNLLNAQDIQVDHDPDAAIKAQINVVFDKLKYSSVQRKKAWQKYPDPKLLYEKLVLLKDINDLFAEMGYTQEQQASAWDTCPDAEILHEMLQGLAGKKKEPVSSQGNENNEEIPSPPVKKEEKEKSSVSLF